MFIVSRIITVLASVVAADDGTAAVGWGRDGERVRDAVTDGSTWWTILKLRLIKCDQSIYTYVLICLIKRPNLKLEEARI